MKSLRVIFQYIKRYPQLVAGYLLMNVLSALFSLVSLAMLAPFLSLIFGGIETKGIAGLAIFDVLAELVKSPEGKIEALGIICLIVVSAILLKNLFLYGALF
ncbi:MAG: hypothetical protein ACK43J_02020, partial [Chitinophagaceae bacterium]